MVSDHCFFSNLISFLTLIPFWNNKQTVCRSRLRYSKSQFVSEPASGYGTLLEKNSQSRDLGMERLSLGKKLKEDFRGAT